MSVGLAFSGGGSKGAAHIGALQALLEENIQIESIAGTSSGSIVASLFAAGYTPMEILNIFRKNARYIKDVDSKIPMKFIKSIFTGKFSVKGLIKGDNLENILRNLFYGKNIKYISDLKIPIYIPVTDLKSNETVIFTNKDKVDLASIVRASSSYPGIFVPKNINGKIYVDGGLKLNNPSNILKENGMDKVISVDFEDKKSIKQVDNVFGIITESFNILNENIKEKTNINADIMILLKLEDKGILNTSKMMDYINEGYYIIKKNIQNIKQELEN